MDVISFENCTCFNLRKAARVVTQVYDEALKPAGLRATQFSLLAMISGMGPITITQLSKQMVMDRTTLTRNLKPLISLDYVRMAVGEDRRQRSVELTPEGHNCLEKATSLWADVQKDVAASLGSKKWNDLMKSLGDAIDTAQDQI
ncbi:MAG: MarR family winged helix-turn-helix transcriptional regulator [Methyloligellaceae bacterium]